MARQIVIWCDPCDAEGEQAVGEELTITVGGEPKTAAWCPRHIDMLIKPIQAILDEYGEDAMPELLASKRKTNHPGAHLPSGNRMGRPPTGGRPQQCLWCDLTYGANSTSGFASHLQTEHGFSNLADALGDTCPICGGGPVKQMLAHGKKTHGEMGFVAATQMYLWARDNGDPYGVYAARMKARGSLAKQ